MTKRGPDPARAKPSPPPPDYGAERARTGQWPSPARATPTHKRGITMSEETTIQNQPDVTEAPTDGAVQVNEAENVTIQQGGQDQGNVAPGGQPTGADEAK